MIPSKRCHVASSKRACSGPRVPYARTGDPNRRIAAAVIARCITDCDILLREPTPEHLGEAADALAWLADDACWATALLGLDGQVLVEALANRWSLTVH